MRARNVVLATGAHERPIAFADNDRPGVMLSYASSLYLEHGVLVGSRTVVFTARGAPTRRLRDEPRRDCGEVRRDPRT